MRFYRNHFGKKLFSHTMGRYFKEELCYVTSFISWFLEWGYRPVGGSFCINDGNDLKEYFVCFSCHHIYNSKLTLFKRTVGKIKFRGRFTQKALQRRQHQTKFGKTYFWLHHGCQETVCKFLLEREDNLKLIVVWKIKHSMHSSADILIWKSGR